MAGPTNVTAAAAIEILAFPYDYTQNDINDAGVNYDVYYKFVAPANAKVMGVWGFSNNVGVGYQPTGYPLNATEDPILLVAAQNVPFQFPVTAGQTYYLLFGKNVNSAGPESLRVRVEVAPDDTVVAGDIIVNDDAADYPTAVLSKDADRTVRRFIKGTASGEAGDVLASNGTMILEDAFGVKNVVVYDYAFNVIATIPQAVVAKIRASQGQNLFYVGSYANPPTVKTVNAAGVVGATTWTLAGNIGLRAIAPNNDGSILYFTPAFAHIGVKTWDLVGNIAGADLTAGIAGYDVCDIFVLADDSILVFYNNTATKDVIVKRHNAAGATLNTYNLGQSEPTAGIIIRGAFAIDDPNSFWVWMHGVGISYFKNIKVSDGSVLSTHTYDEFEQGGWVQAQTANPTSRFGNSYSCPFLISRAPAAPTPIVGGIYYIHPDKATKHDSYYNDIEKKIPNPTVRLAFIGD